MELSVGEKVSFQTAHNCKFELHLWELGLVLWCWVKLGALERIHVEWWTEGRR